MITVNIVSVEKGPQTEEPWESDNGTIHKTAWLCNVDAGGVQEQAKVTVGSKSPGHPPNGKYIEAGRAFCSKQRKEYQGVAQYWLDSTATKALHGDSYGGGQSGGGSSGGAGGASKGGGYDGVGQSIGNAITNATSVAVAEMKSGDGRVDISRLSAVALAIFSISRELNASVGAGVSGAAPDTVSGQMNDPMREKLLQATDTAIDKAGLRGTFDQVSIPDDEVIKLWNDCAANESQFVIRLNNQINRLMAGEKTGDPSDDEKLPF